MNKLEQLFENLYRYKDSCNVYIIVQDNQGILIDFGSGSVLSILPQIGVEKIAAVLLTHHHRDQLFGLANMPDTGRFLYVPHSEQELIAQADLLWQRREILNNYNTRQDLYSSLSSLPICSTLKDYETLSLLGYDFQIMPTPGHTPGSVSLKVATKDQILVFTGDLLYAAGKVWSLAATQWSYNGGEGIPHTILSLLQLEEDRDITFLLPSHGEVLSPDAIKPTVENLTELLKVRRHNPRLFLLREKPYEEITPHLLFNRTSMSNSYILLSQSGKALVLDLGYDFAAGLAAGTDRSARRPWLYTFPWLFEHYPITSIDAFLPTHYHDDHVAGANLLRSRYGTRILCPENFAAILEAPTDYSLPCLWYDPIKVDQVLPVNQVFQWEEYEITLYPLSGHTEYSVAIAFKVDGKQVLCGGDQYADGDGLFCNYVYQNQFAQTDFISSAQLYQEINPDIYLTGHWTSFYQSKDYLSKLLSQGEKLADLHNRLLPQGEDYHPITDFFVKVFPYQKQVDCLEKFTATLLLSNPKNREVEADVELLLPRGFEAENCFQRVILPSLSTTEISFQVESSSFPQRRARLGVNLTLDNHIWGSQGEMLITVNSAFQQ